MCEQQIRFLIGTLVYLRPLLRSDIPSLLRWVNDLEVKQFLMNFLPQMEKQEEEWFDDLAKRQNHVVFAVCLSENDRVIGTMGIHNISWKDRTASTGALIGEKDCWSKGYGSEAKMLLLHWAFTELNLRKINSSVLAFNGRSQRYLEKTGYVVEGVKKKQHFVHNRYCDELIMSVFKQDFLPLWRKFKKERLS